MRGDVLVVEQNLHLVLLALFDCQCIFPVFVYSCRMLLYGGSCGRESYKKNDFLFFLFDYLIFP